MNKKTKQLVVQTFGLERLIAGLPQHEVKQKLELQTVEELAEAVGTPVSTYRSKMAAGKVPYPEIRLRRRAYYSIEQAAAIITNWEN